MRRFCQRWNAEIAKRYGRKQGLLRHYYFLLMYLLGGYRRYTRIDWGEVARIVFICKGNICRSPYAEMRTRSLGFNASSFGLYANKLSIADPTATRIAATRGLDLATHRSRLAEDLFLAQDDLLVVMEPWQARRILKWRQNSGAQITLLGLWYQSRRPHIEDPYGLDEDYFDACFSVIDNCIESILNRVARSKVRTPRGLTGRLETASK